MLLFKRKDKKLTKQHSRSESADRGTPPSKPLLGVPLQVAVANSPSYDGIPVPALVRRCIDFVEEHGLEAEGIYRVAPSVSWLDECERLANCGGPVVFNEPHDASNLLKRFLRQLPDHILRFPPYVPATFEAVAETCKCPFEKPCQCEVVVKIKEMLAVAPKENLYLLAYVFIHANHVIQKQNFNKMTLPGLGVLLQAMISVSKNIIKLFILNAIPSEISEISSSTVYLFNDIPFKRYVPPLTSEQLNSNPPETLAAIESEISKQQYLLEEINDQVLQLRQQGVDTKQKEHDMWECQHAITSLKRRLKTVTRETRQDGDDEASTSLVSENGSISEAGPILEKQLLAVQSSLIEEIADEQRQIAELTNRLYELQRDIKQNLAAQKTPPQDRGVPYYRPKMAPPPPPPQAPIYDPAVVKGISTDGILEENLPTCNECHRQEARKQTLVDHISQVRTECAQLRAKLENSRETAIAAADDFGTSSVLVTKF